MSNETSTDLQTYLDELHMEEKELTLLFREIKYEYEKHNKSFTEIQDELFFELARTGESEMDIDILPYLVQAIVFGILWERSDNEVSVDG